jgi:hypothetical protein
MGAGAPILIIMPLLILVPRWYLRVKAAESVPKEKRLSLQRFSHYWTERFVFAVILWMNFIAFQAATPSINAFPSPGTACTTIADPPTVVTDTFDPKAVCYSDYMAGAHTLAVIVVLVICVLFPLFQWKICRRVNYLGLEDEVASETFLTRYGAIYGANADGWRRYWGLVVYFNTVVLIGTLGNWLVNDPNLGLPISSIVVCSAVMLGFLFLHPSAERFDDVVESYFLAVQISSLALQIAANNFLLTQNTKMEDGTEEKVYAMNADVRPRVHSRFPPMIESRVAMRAQPTSTVV